MGVFGDTLRQARAHKGVTLKEAEQATRINRHHLAALEDENFVNLPPLIYQRGIVRNYATYLDLDPGKLLAMFEEARGGGAPVDLVAAVKPLDMPSHWAPNFAIIAFMVVMSAIIFAWVYSISFNTPPTTATLPAAVPTVTPLAEQSALKLPSPTPLPTSTATPRAIATKTPVATVVPTAAATAVATAAAPVQTTNDAQVAQAQQAAQPVPTDPPVQQVQTAPQGPGVTLKFIGGPGGVQLTVIGDGSTYYSNWLAEGAETEWMTASQFTVSTSDVSKTLIVNADNPSLQFVMDTTSRPAEFPLP